MNKKLVTLLCVLALLVAAIGVTAAAEETSAIAKIGDTPYENLADAIADVNTEDPVSTVITLQKPVQQAVTFDTTAYLDLNGCDIGPVTVAEGCTLYCFDFATDDYQIEGDEETGYYGFGRLTVADDSKGEIKGVAAGDGFNDSYLKVTEDAGISFHRVTLQITDMTLRTKNDDEEAYNPGLYYKSTFAGDELVAQNVASFGIALSVTEEPNAENFGINNKCSAFTNFVAGETGNAGITSTILKSILKESNGKLTNSSYAQMPIYGRAYVLTNHNDYVFGIGVSRSFQEQIEAISVEIEWSDLESGDQQGILAMYKPYQSLMKTWSVDTIRNTFLAEEDKIVRILNISNSHGQDSVWLLPEVIRTEKGEDYQFMVAECYFSGALTEHVKNANSYAPEYVYWTSTGGHWDRTDDVTIQYALNAERWDYIMFNESSRHLGLERYMQKDLIGQFLHYIDYRLDYEPKLFYNMTWANPTDDRFHDTAYTDGNRRAAIEGFKATYTADYGYDRENHYNCLVAMTEKYLVDHPAFDKIIWNATPIQYAWANCGVPEWDDNQVYDLYRDYTHLSDFARLIVAYQFYAQFFELEEITEVNVDVIPTRLRATTWQQKLGDLTITDGTNDTKNMKQVIMDCVNHTLKNPLTIEVEG